MVLPCHSVSKMDWPIFPFVHSPIMNGIHCPIFSLLLTSIGTQDFLIKMHLSLHLILCLGPFQCQSRSALPFILTPVLSKMNCTLSSQSTNTRLNPATIISKHTLNTSLGHLFDYWVQFPGYHSVCTLWMDHWKYNWYSKGPIPCSQCPVSQWASCHRHYLCWCPCHW